MGVIGFCFNLFWFIVGCGFEFCCIWSGVFNVYLRLWCWSINVACVIGMCKSSAWMFLGGSNWYGFGVLTVGFLLYFVLKCRI